MWITKPEHDRLREAAAQVAVLQGQAAAMAANQEWLRTRVNQLEQERAQLVARVLQVPVNVPHIQPIRPSSPLDARPDPKGPSQADVLAQAGAIGMFEDIGDDLAEKLGIFNDEANGTLIYESRRA